MGITPREEPWANGKMPERFFQEDASTRNGAGSVARRQDGLSHGAPLKRHGLRRQTAHRHFAEHFFLFVGTADDRFEGGDEFLLVVDQPA